MSDRRVLKGVGWSAIERFSVQIVQFFISIILARLLNPQAFGLVAIALVFIGIFQTINESGFNIALVHNQKRDEVDFSTAFYSNIILGLVAYFVIFLLSPYIASLYGDADLSRVLRLLALNLVINSFAIVQNAIFLINLNFKTQAKASFIAAIVSGIIGVFYSYHYRNVYGIVVQSLSFSFFNVCLMFVFLRWRPKFIFSLERLRRLVNYSGKLILSRVINVVFEDLYILVIGKFFSPTQLGYFNRAQSFKQFISKNLINLIQRVSLPLLCEQQDDLEKMKEVLIKTIVGASAIVFPLLTGLMVLGDSLVIVVLGEKWLPTAEIFFYVCPAGFFYLISTFNRNVFNATGKTNLALRSEIIKKIYFVIIFLLSIQFGFFIVLLGLSLIAFLDMLYDVFYAKKQIGIRFFSEIYAVRYVILSSSLMGVFIVLLKHCIVNAHLQLFLCTLLGALIYFVCCFIFNVFGFRNRIHFLLIGSK